MRIDFEISTLIDRPVADVFAFVTDPGRLPLWDRRVVEAGTTGGEPVSHGSRIREVRQVGRKRMEQTVEVSAFEPPHRFGLRIVDGPIPVHGDLRFQSEGEASIVCLHAHGEMPGPELLAPAVTAMARLQMRAQYRRLKRVLEAGAGLQEVVPSSSG